MNKLITLSIEPGRLSLASYNRAVEEVCKKLKFLCPDWCELDKETILSIVNNPTEWADVTFIVPCKLVEARRPTTKLGKLIFYMFSAARRYKWNFVVVGPSLDAIDKRIRDQITKVEEWK